MREAGISSHRHGNGLGNAVVDNGQSTGCTKFITAVVDNDGNLLASLNFAACHRRAINFSTQLNYSGICVMVVQIQSILGHLERGRILNLQSIGFGTLRLVGDDDGQVKFADEVLQAAGGDGNTVVLDGEDSLAVVSAVRSGASLIDLQSSTVSVS